MPKTVTLPDGKTATFPDSMSPEQIKEVLRRKFGPTKSFGQMIKDQITNPSSPTTFKEELAAIPASLTGAMTRKRLKDTGENYNKFVEGNDPKAELDLSPIPFINKVMTREEFDALPPGKKALAEAFIGDPLSRTVKGGIEDIWNVGLGGLVTRGAGLATRALGATKLGTAMSNVGRKLTGGPFAPTIAKEKEEIAKLTKLNEKVGSIKAVREKIIRLTNEAKENVAEKSASGKELIKQLKSGNVEVREKIKGAFGVSSIAKATKAIKDSLGKTSLEDEIAGSLRSMSFGEQALLKNPLSTQNAKKIMEVMDLDDPAALDKAVREIFKDFKDIDTKGIFEQLEKLRISKRGNKTLDEMLNQFKENFSKALPEEARLGQGIIKAGEGKVIQKTPLTPNAGRVTPEVEEAMGVAHPIMMSMSRYLRPQSVLSGEKAGAEFYNLSRSVGLETTIQSSRLMKQVLEEGAKHPEIRRKAIGRFLDGQAEILSPAEAATAAKMRKITDFIADKAGIPKERRVKNYLTRFIDVDDTGLPTDVIETTASLMALDAAKAKQLGNVGREFMEAIPSLRESNANIARNLFGRLDFLTKSKFLDKAKNALRGTPSKVYYGPLSSSRSAGSRLTTDDFQEVLTRYIPGAYRKIHLDSLLGWFKTNQSRLSPELRNYSDEYLEVMRGTLGASELTTTLALERYAMALETQGSKIIPAIARFLKPRRLSAGIRKWQFNAKIGGNMATALVNLSQTAINTVTEVGFKRTSAAIAEYIGGGAKVTKMLERAGIARQTHLGDINPNDMDRVTKVLSFMFQQTEEFNRGVAFLAGHSEARAAGKSITEAIKAGQKLVDDTQFVFSKENVPLAFQSPVGAVLFQFKNYLWNQLQFIKRITVNAGKHPEKFARMIATMGIVGGTKGLTLGTFGSLMVSEINEKDWDDWIKHTVMFGVPGGAGVDISESIGLRIFPTAPGTPEDMQRSLREILGPTGSAISEVMLSGVIEEMRIAIATGTSPDPEVMKKFNRTLLKNMPAGVAVDRFLSADEDLTGRRQRKQVEETPRDRNLRALFGARTTQVSKTRELQKFLLREDDLSNRRSRLVKDHFIDNIEEWRAGRQSLESMAAKYGASMDEVPWDSIPDDIVQREMPTIVRTFDNLSKPMQNRIMILYPKLAKEIRSMKRRAADRLQQRRKEQK